MSEKKYIRHWQDDKSKQDRLLDIIESDEYAEHVGAMTREDLPGKSHIAIELARRDITISQQAIRIEELEMAFGEACVFIGRVSAEALQDNYSYLDQMKGQLKLGFTASGEPIVQSPSLSTEKK